MSNIKKYARQWRNVESPDYSEIEDFLIDVMAQGNMFFWRNFMTAILEDCDDNVL